MSKRLVIVESPTKVKKLQGFLGKDYQVMASMGHVRDLPAKAAEIPARFKKEPWATLGVNVEGGFEPLYVVPADKRKQVKALKEAYKKADELVIATDADREGESIGWHLVQVLGATNGSVRRMSFTEITPEAIRKAVGELKDLNGHLVSAQETRRILDRLYGYTLSPLLWKKIARGLSAGRVQSVAVRLLVLRELERLRFRKGAYWDLKARLAAADGAFDASLESVGGKRVASGRDFDAATGRLKEGADVLLLNENDARALAERLGAEAWKVASIESAEKTRRPYPPFTTSTLQQEANRKLRFSARQTMQVAQRLYENGHITYMRTDSVHLSNEAIGATRRCIEARYGKEFLSPSPRQFTSRSKTAQEAHEAIRPAGTAMQTAEELGLSGPEGALYTLIWKRAMACQMAEARVNFQTVMIDAGDARFRATGKTVLFAGFFRAYVEGVDDPDAALDDQEAMLPRMQEGDGLRCERLEALSHETSPPARYTEATLVKALEAEEIGRPSTYASIIGTIQDRGYVVKTNNQLIPTFVAMAVTHLLEEHFPELVDVHFTAQMEKTLDDIALGSADEKSYLKDFYFGDAGLAQQVRSKEEHIDARLSCTLQLDGIEFEIRVGRFGPYVEVPAEDGIQTVSLPADIAPGDLTNELIAELIENKQKGPQSLGVDAESGLPVFVLRGPFGPYVQLGESAEEGKKPKRVSIPKTMDPDALTLEQAQSLLALPRTLGKHPETGKVVKASIGRFGPYVVHEGKYKSLGKLDVLTIGLEEAVELLKQAKTRAVEPLRELGKDPQSGETVALFEGRYGPYVKLGKVNASIPKDADPNGITLEEALKLLAERAAKPKTRRRRRSA